PGGYGRLQLVEGTHTTRACTWENAVDGDIYWWDGTTEGGIDATGTAWAIFEFIDESIRPIHTIRLLTDTGVGCDPMMGRRIDSQNGNGIHTRCDAGKQATEFEVWVSTDGIALTKVLDATKTNNVCTPCEFFDDWMTWQIDPVDAKYIKLVLKQPQKYGYIALGEFEVWFDAPLADAGESSLSLAGDQVTVTVKDADGNPISGLTHHDIVIYSYNTDGYYGDPRTALGVLIGEDAGEPGVYTGMISNKGVVRASVNGVLIPGAGSAGQAAQPLALPKSEELEPVQALPTEFALDQNYPNPFNPQTTIHYQLPEATEVTLAIYDLSGRVVATLVDGLQPAGYHNAIWNSSDQSSGIYFYQLTAGSYRAVKRMALVR
ncbi:T9SS type A sorting domain-containing protein, partial [candidate division KSB1 bacterium]|nr:T9SS type A sorting domain-containing protein [candidate division KSB1 bacterium]